MGVGEKVDNALAAGIALIIIMVALIAMTPTIIEQVEGAVSAADTWNFTGASGAESLLGLVPFIWIAAIVLVAVVGSFLIAKSLGNV